MTAITGVTEAQTRGLVLDDQLCFALYAATSAITRAYRAPLADIGLTYTQYLVMLALWQHGPATVGQVATRLRLDPHAVSPVAARLEATGLVVRRRGRDRRTHVLEPTPDGLALREEAARVQRDVVCATGLAPDALTRLREELLALTAHLARPTAPAPPAPTPPAPTPPRQRRPGDQP